MYHVTWVRPTPGQKSVRCFVQSFVKKLVTSLFSQTMTDPVEIFSPLIQFNMLSKNIKLVFRGGPWFGRKVRLPVFWQKCVTKHRTDFCPGVGRTHVTWYISSWGIDWYRSHYVIVFGLHKRRPQYPRGYPEVPPRTSVGTSQVRPGKSGYIQKVPGSETTDDFT